jgi:acyl-[acyl carrier protein]--UDP-N-acetylglucosamine O-acyltransferase
MSGVDRFTLASRARFNAAPIRNLRNAFSVLFGTRRNLQVAIAELEAQGDLTPEVAEMIVFRASKRGVAFGPKSSAIADPTDE